MTIDTNTDSDSLTNGYRQVKSVDGENFDLVITSMKLDLEIETPCLVGTPFLIGIGEENLKENILSILKK